MRLPDSLENELWVEILKIEEERKMRYVSSVERIGYKRGWDEGKIEGRTEGREEGREEGWVEGRIEAIELGLSLKFGDDAAQLLMPSIRNLQDPDFLLMIRDAIRVAENIEDIQLLIINPQGQA
jgi:predicted transposase YdaD